MSEVYIRDTCRLSGVPGVPSSEVSYTPEAALQRENRSSASVQSTTFQKAVMNSGRRFWYYT